MGTALCRHVRELVYPLEEGQFVAVPVGGRRRSQIMGVRGSAGAPLKGRGSGFFLVWPLQAS